MMLEKNDLLDVQIKYCLNSEGFEDHLVIANAEFSARENQLERTAGLNINANDFLPPFTN